MQPETKYWWVIFIPVLASVRGMAPETTPVLAVGVTADPPVEQVPLERFDGMTKSELWDDPRYDREHSWPKSRGFKKEQGMVNDVERRRSTVVSLFQGNRNPLIAGVAGEVDS